MISNDLRQMLFSFAENEVTLEQFEDWLVPRLPLLISDPDSANAEVVAAVELGLAELSSGIRSATDVRSLVRKALSEQSSVWTSYPTEQGRWSSSGSSSDTSDISHWSRSVEFIVQVV